MKRIFNQSIFTYLLTLGLGSIFLVSCSDDFTEEDALNAQQTLDVSVFVTDLFDSEPLANAQVTMLLNGGQVTSTTNDFGLVLFTDVPISTSIPFTVELENYTSVQVNRSISTSNFRQAQTTINISLLSTTENLATVRGTLEIESDLTNTEVEVVPEGTVITAILDVGLGQSNVLSFTAATAADGSFEFSLPADLNGVEYDFVYPTLTLDQTIAKNKDEGQPDFPQTLPSIVTISTTYNVSDDAIAIPTVPSVFGTVPASASGSQAIIGDVDVDTDGIITNIDINDGGSGYTTTSEVVTITSLFGGSGADITVAIVGDAVSTETINSGGTGYPTFFDANQANQLSPNVTTSVELTSGEVRVINGTYGTGTSRAEDVE